MQTASCSPRSTVAHTASSCAASAQTRSCTKPVYRRLDRLRRSRRNRRAARTPRRAHLPSCLPPTSNCHQSKKLFTRSNQLLLCGLCRAPPSTSDFSNCLSRSRCGSVSLTGVSTCTCTYRSPAMLERNPLMPLPRRPERLARLRAFRHREARAARERGHFDFAAQRRRGERNRHLAMQVVAVALEHRVLLDVNLDVQIARRTAVDARLAVARRADAHAVVDTCRDLHFQRLGFLHLARAVAVARTAQG